MPNHYHVVLHINKTQMVNWSQDEVIEQWLKLSETLFSFVGNPWNDMPEGLPFKLNDYIDLVEWTGRQINPSKRCAIPQNTPAIIERLNFDKKHWLYVTTHFESKLKGLVGSFNSLTKACQKLNYKRTICKYSCETYFP
ncbi:hypothetical protein MNBD_GAMMA07-246 [hydrothermal vent metagenome]|uniref:Transposase and inactivated derivatives n=1 Tax=hydrothermal vent metagenome TaxID=652676 RepID=A0A3B0WNV6_9ZZZZ